MGLGNGLWLILEVVKRVARLAALIITQLVQAAIRKSHVSVAT